MSARFWRRYEWTLLLLCAGLVTWQLFLPPSLGVADNNDFPKLMGRYCLGEAGHPLFEYVSFTYQRAPSYCWDSGLLSSAVLPLNAALLVGRVFLPPDRFDLRVLGAVYAVLFLAGFRGLQMLSRSLRPLPRMLLPAAAILIFAGAAYVPWFSTFYFDTASYLGLLLCAVALGWLVLSQEIKTWQHFVTAALVLFFAMSKPQHAPLALLMLPCLWLSFGRAGFPGRAVRLMTIAVVAGGVAVMLATVPRGYNGVASYNALFYQALPRSANPAADLAWLGVDASMRGDVGRHAFLPNSPVEKPLDAEAFASKVPTSRLALYFLAHPRTSAKVLSYALEEGSLQRVRMKIGPRQYRLGNYEREWGHGPETQSHFLTQWSDWKATVFGNHPRRYAAYAVVLFIGLWALAWRRPPENRPQVMLLLAVLTAMTGMALVAVMFDGVDTGRHLFIFNTLLDLAVCAGIALL